MLCKPQQCVKHLGGAIQFAVARNTHGRYHTAIQTNKELSTNKGAGEAVKKHFPTHTDTTHADKNAQN